MGKKLNIKLFRNGVIQLAGCKIFLIVNWV